jgi:SAM-dependent methyltransferase
MGGGPNYDDQRRFWNAWNTSWSEYEHHVVSRRQARVVTEWLARLGRVDLDILEVGCGSGWLAPRLSAFGRLTATDLADEVIREARRRYPGATFMAGDFMALDLPEQAFDVVVTLEVLAHVADQPAFMAKVARLLRPGGLLMMATQNRFVLERFNRVPPPAPGQLRRWVKRGELHDLAELEFDVHELFTITPIADRGVMRLVNSKRLNRAIGTVVGGRLERLKEKAGLGWTLMLLAEARGEPVRPTPSESVLSRTRGDELPISRAHGYADRRRHHDGGGRADRGHDRDRPGDGTGAPDRHDQRRLRRQRDDGPHAPARLGGDRPGDPRRHGDPVGRTLDRRADT